MDAENKINMQTAPPGRNTAPIWRAVFAVLQILHCFKPEGRTQCGSAKVTVFIVAAGKTSFVFGFFELNF